jgi:hypothetical protein
MEKSGAVTQAVAMKISGPKTDSVYRRYRIGDEADIKRAAQEHRVEKDLTRTNPARSSR